MDKRAGILILLVSNVASASAAVPLLPAAQLRVEYLEEPIVIDTLLPRFSWLVGAAAPARSIAQASYRILVVEALSNATAWDSGAIASDATAQVAYAGAPLTSDTVYTWRVQWASDAASGNATAPWSAPARFGTGLLTQDEWLPAAWIGCSGGANQLRAEVDVGAAAGVEVTQARLYVSAIGYFLARVNGAWARQWGVAGDDFSRPRLDPGVTTYQSRALYNAFDVTTQIVASGQNAIAFVVGHGWPIIGPVPGNSSAITLAGTCFDHATDPEFQQNDNGLSFACPAGQVFTAVPFASYGNAPGACDGSTPFSLGPCHANASVAVVARNCLGRRFCNVDFHVEFADPCFGVGKWFSANLTCGNASAASGALATARREAPPSAWWATASEGERRARAVEHVSRRLSQQLQDSPGGLRAILSVKTSDGKTKTWTTSAASFDAGPSAGAAAWACASGAYRFDSIYDGSTYDASRETVGWDLPGFNSSAWAPAVLAADPGGATPTVMTAQTTHPIAAVVELPAVLLTSPSPNTWIVDFAQNAPGIVRMRLPGPVPPNVTIILRHGEVLMHEPYGPSDGSMYTGELRSALATDSYTTAGGDDDEIFEAAFTFHGFRFCEVTGLYMTPTEDMFTHIHMRSAVPTVGSIAFPAESARVLNQLQHAAQWSISGNLFSLQSDCNNRDERKGWLGDSALSLYAAPLNFELGSFYSFWAQSMRDSQVTPLDEHPVGALPDTVPHTFAEYPADPAWGSAFPGVIYSLWRHYGDTRAATAYYDAIAAYIGFLQLQIEDEGASGIGNLFASAAKQTPPAFPPPTSNLSFTNPRQNQNRLTTGIGCHLPTRRAEAEAPTCT